MYRWCLHDGREKERRGKYGIKMPEKKMKRNAGYQFHEGEGLGRVNEGQEREKGTAIEHADDNKDSGKCWKILVWSENKGVGDRRYMT